MVSQQVDRIESLDRPGVEWPFFGRDTELDVVATTLAGETAASDGSRGALVVAPPGVGKSRLLQEVRRWAGERSLPTATVIATEAASQTPFGAMRHLVPEPVDDPWDLLERDASLVASLRPEGRPTVLLVDDAHHLDKAGASLLLRLVIEGSVTPVVAVRLGHAVPDPVRSLWKDGLLVRVDLPPFSPAQMGDLIELVLGGPLSERTCQRLVAVSNGNVRYARELVAAAVDGGSLQLRDGTWVWDQEVVLAPRLVDAVWEQLESLSADARRGLAMVALGAPLPLGAAERLSDPTVLSQMEQAGLILLDSSCVGQDVLRLGNVLYGEVLLDRLGQLGRRYLVAELADAVEGDATRTELDRLRIVKWRLEAGVQVSPGDLADAAAQANLVLDHRLAARFARAALTRVVRAGSDEATSREPVVLELAEALGGGSTVGEAKALLDGVEESVLAAGRGPLVDLYLDIQFRAAYLGLGQAAEVQSLLSRVASTVEDRGGRGEQAVAVYRASIALGEGRPDEAVSTAEPLLDEPGLPEVQRLLAVETVGEALCCLGMPSRASAVWDRLRDLSACQGRLAVAATEVELQAAFGAQLDGRVADALPVATAMCARLETSPDVVGRGLASLALGRCLLLAGRLGRARAVLLDAASDFRREDLGGSEAWALVLLSQTAALEGRPEAARRWRDEARSCQRPSGTARDWADLVAADVWLAAAAGDLARARVLALDGADRFPTMHMSRAALLHLAVRMGERGDRVGAALHEIADRVEAGYPGLLADHADALGSGDGIALEAVAESFAARGLDPLAAEASVQAARAHELAGSVHDAHRATARAACLVRRTGSMVTPALTELSTLFALSRRELDIAQQAASGLSNADIATRCVLSVRTVESHLYRVFAKLGISSRSELARFLPGPTAPEHWSLTASGH